MKTKKLYRSTDDYIVGGVCAGLGEYFNIDPVIVRILFILLTLGNGVGLVVYIILMIVLPKRGHGEYNDDVRKEHAKEFVNDIKHGVKNFAKEMKIEDAHHKKEGKDLMAVLLIIFGFILFFNQIFPTHWFRWDLFWPLIIIFIGFWILFKKEK